METSAAIQVLEATSSVEPNILSVALECLAAASRVPAQRQLLDTDETTERLLLILGEHHDSGVIANALRCIGNVCADNEDGRVKVTSSGFSWTGPLLRSDKLNLSSVAIKVLYNICKDYEPAQQQAVRENVHFELIGHLAERAYETENVLGITIEILLWMSSQLAVIGSIDLPRSGPGAELILLPETVHCEDVEDFAGLMEVCLVYLRDFKVQEQLVGSRDVNKIWEMLEINEGRIQSLADQAIEFVLSETDEAQIQDDIKLLLPLSASITWCLSDIAALPIFAQRYAVSDELIQRLVGILKIQVQAASADRSDVDQTTGTNGSVDATTNNDRYFRLQCAACQVLGNLLWNSPDDALVLVEQAHLYVPLLRNINTSSNSDHLFSAANLLVHLARPSQKIREDIVGDPNAGAVLGRLCRYNGAPLVQQAGQKLLRVLVGGSRLNLERLKDIVAEVSMSEQTNDGVEQSEQLRVTSADLDN